MEECACRRVSAGKKVKKQSRHEHAGETQVLYIYTVQHMAN